ncbi:TetR/AcrR family transcriptional regulator [Streptomyces sp. NPDC046977]|uniref:TetR/AcrR family transcriptional regulator n=1 Tax=Streptomyces sp. NPDC046977 TaxID=3154703 RepID=UPI003402D409
MTAPRTDNRLRRGNETRRLVLSRATALASVEGLEGLSLGRLAAELGLSKSGVFALFGSKEELQLAAVRAAREVYFDHVVRPPRELPPGIARVWRLCEGWLEYSRSRVFPGGCFFLAVAAEFDARTGPVHDLVAEARLEWITYVEITVEKARGAGQLRADLDVPLLAFELIALMESGNLHSVLFDDASAYTKAGTAVLARLRAVASAEAPPLPARFGD